MRAFAALMETLVLTPSRNRKLELHFKQILAHKIKVAKQLCLDLREERSLEASDAQIDAMATNMVVVATYWLSYEYVRNPRKYSEQQAIADALARGALSAPGLDQDDEAKAALADDGSLYVPAQCAYCDHEALCGRRSRRRGMKRGGSSCRCRRSRR